MRYTKQREIMLKVKEEVDNAGIPIYNDIVEESSVLHAYIYWLFKTLSLKENIQQIDLDINDYNQVFGMFSHFTHYSEFDYEIIDELVELGYIIKDKADMYSLNYFKFNPVKDHDYDYYISPKYADRRFEIYDKIIYTYVEDRMNKTNSSRMKLITLDLEHLFKARTDEFLQYVEKMSEDKIYNFNGIKQFMIEVSKYKANNNIIQFQGVSI